METTTIPRENYYNSPPFNGFPFSNYLKAYYLATGVLSTIGNFYLIILFVMFSRLRQLQCNWLIIFLCTSDFFVGVGTLIRVSIIINVMNSLTIYIPFLTCTLLAIPFAVGYRVGQAIALIIALDRFFAIWKPFSYNKYQSTKIVFTCGLINVILIGILIFILFYAMDLDAPETLDDCISPISNIWYKILPTYSGVISIFFFGLYFSSLLILFRHLSATKKQQIHAHKSLSRVQMKVFITVSYALFCYSIFYGVPTILQMLCYYFNITGWVAEYSTYSIIWGGEFNGILNSLIYIFKHQEFWKCTKQIIYKFTGKMKQVSSIQKDTTQGRSLFVRSDKSIPSRFKASSY